jgi:hypothetical protein
MTGHVGNLPTELAAAAPMFHQTNMLVFYGLAIACLVVTQVPLIVDRDLTFKRRLWWGGTAGAALFTVLGTLPQWLAGLGLAAAGVFGMTLTAYFATSYIKIGDEIFAFHTYDAEPDRRISPLPSDISESQLSDSYGTDVTNTKMWWLMVGTSAFCVGAAAVQFLGPPKWAIVIALAVVLTVIAIGFGFMDAKAGHRVAREQFVQFGLIAVITVGVFPMLYLCSYSLARPR